MILVVAAVVVGVGVVAGVVVVAGVLVGWRLLVEGCLGLFDDEELVVWVGLGLGLF